MAKQRKLDVGPFPSPCKCYKKTRERVNVDNFGTDAICRTGHDFYERRECRVLDQLLQVLKEKELFSRRSSDREGSGLELDGSISCDGE